MANKKKRQVGLYGQHWSPDEHLERLLIVYYDVLCEDQDFVTNLEELFTTLDSYLDDNVLDSASLRWESMSWLTADRVRKAQEDSQQRPNNAQLQRQAKALPHMLAVKQAIESVHRN